MNSNDPEKKDLYLIFLIGFFLILSLPLITSPFLFSPTAWGKAIIFRIIISILIFLFIFQLISNQAWKTLRSLLIEKSRVFWPLWLLIALLAAYFLATVFSLDPRFSFWGSPLRGDGSLNFILCIIFTLLSFLIIKKSDWKKIWFFNILIGVFVSLIALFQQFNIFSRTLLSYSGRPPATMGGSIFLGLYLILLVFLAFSFGLKEKGKKKIFYISASLLFMFVIILTGSRAAYLGLIIGLLYFIFASKKLLPLKIAFITLLLICGIIVYYVNTHSELPGFLEKNTIIKSLLDRLSIELVINDARFSTWLISIEAIKDRPILGFGPENFSIAFDKYYDPFLPYINKESGSWYDRAHSFIFGIGTTSGIPALVIYISLFAVLFWQLNKIKHQDLIIHGIQATFIAYLASNLFSFDVFSTYLILFLIVAYSLTLLAPNNVVLSFLPKIKQGEFKPFKPVFLSILFFVLIFFIWFGALKPLGINKKINLADYYIRTNQCQKAIEMHKEILSSQSIIDSYAKLKYVETIEQCNTKIPGLKTVLAPKVISILKEASEIRPYYTRIWIFLANYTNILIENDIEGLEEETYSYFEKAYQLSPKREEIFIPWIQTSLLLKEYEKAEAKAEECVQLIPQSSYCWWLKGISNFYLNNIEQAEKDMDLAVELGHDAGTDSSLVSLLNAYLEIPEENIYYEKIIDIYEKLTLRGYNMPDSYFELVKIYKKLGNYEEIEKISETVITFWPELKPEVDEFLETLYDK